MQCYTELAPPTALTHAVALSLLAASAQNLAVAKTSLLQIFTVRRPDESTPHARLELLGEYPLAGIVTGLARVKTLDSTTGGDALLISTKDAKLSLVEWDAENHRISTVSIHYYEGENVVNQPFGPDLSDCESILAVDPDSRCAALKFGERHLAILPFRQAGEELIGDEDEEMNGEPAAAAFKRQQSALQNTNGETEGTPYKPSFVLPLTTLDPILNHTVDLAFLHEYREPTFGILSASIAPSTSLLADRKDLLTYTVFTLDLEQRASTNLITVPKLPSSLWKVVPLPLPIGGALLIGTNEFVHIDQSGKANATAVNEFAKLASDFGMADQSHLNLKLEDCAVELLDLKTGELLVILNDGSFATLTFQMMGRSVGAVNVARCLPEDGGMVFQSMPSCTARLADDKIFVGSEDGPSSLLTWSRHNALNRKRSYAQMLGKEPNGEDDEEDAELDDDDLYAAAPEAKKQALSANASAADSGAYHFAVGDQLPSTGPIHNVCFGRSKTIRRDKLNLVAATGRGRASRLTCMNRDIVPEIVHRQSHANAKDAWSVFAKPDSEPEEGEELDDTEQAEYHSLLFVYDGARTKVHSIVNSEPGKTTHSERDAPEFEQEGHTLDVQAVANGTCIVQVRRSDIITYTSSLGLSQIIPMLDEETDDEFTIVATSFCDPYVLVIRDNSSVQVLHVQGRELEPLEGQAAVLEKKWLSGCVYAGPLTNGDAVLFLLTAEGALQAFSLPDLEPRYTIANLAQLPPVIATDGPQRRAGTKEALAELLIADLGHGASVRPYLILRTALDDLVLYEPFTYPSLPSGSPAWPMNLRWRKVPAPPAPAPSVAALAEEGAADRPPPTLKRIRLGDYSTVVLPGAPAMLLIKESHSNPKVLQLRGTSLPSNSPRIGTVAPFRGLGCEDGFTVLSEDGEIQACRLPRETRYGTGWAVRGVELSGQGEVRHVAFHEERGVYVVGTCRGLGEGEGGDDPSLPTTPQCTLHLLSPTTHHILHSLPLPAFESLTALAILPLEISEHTHIHALRIVAAAASLRGEDSPARGSVTVLEILPVVPDPDDAESGIAMKIFAREETKGAVTALAAFPGGLLGTAQGLKIMIRGLKADGSCLPVAFLDVTSYTHVLKTLPGEGGVWLAGDVAQGVTLGAFVEEPYKLLTLGRGKTRGVEVMAAEMLPQVGALYCVLSDGEGAVRVLQFDPEGPESAGGRRLVERAGIRTAGVSGMVLLPISPLQTEDLDADSDDAAPPLQAQQAYALLTTSHTGALGLLTPLPEPVFRRLSALQTHLTNVLEHPAGLNPRGFRALPGGGRAMAGYDSGSGVRAVVDGDLVRRVSELGAARRADVIGRVGGDAVGTRGEVGWVECWGVGVL